MISAGALEVEVGGTSHSLTLGDAMLFEADEPHTYRNRSSSETVVYLVMHYADDVG